MQAQAQHAHRLSVLGPVDGRVAHLRPIDDRHSPAPLDLDGLVAPDEHGGILVESDADRERVVGERGEEPPEAVALAEVLIDDEAVG